MTMPDARLAGWARTREEHAVYRALGMAEREAVVARACVRCGAPRRQLCHSPTGLPASGPCRERMTDPEPEVA